MIVRFPRESERGQVLIEFALAATLVLAILLGIFEFGRALFAYDLVAQAARVGTRFAIVNAAACKANQSTCENSIKSYITSKVSGIDPTQVVPTITWQQTGSPLGNCYDPGCYVNIHLSYNFTFVALPLPARTLDSSSQLVISQ